MTVYLAYATTGKEFEVADKLAADGFDVWLARKIDFIRRGKRRRPDPVERPRLPNYLFLSLTDAEWHRLHQNVPKYLAGTMYALRRDDERELDRFRGASDTEYAKAQKAAQNQEAIAEYVRGQRIVDVTGTFGDACLTFRRMVERAQDLHPRIEAEMEMLGRVVKVELDPLDVRAAE